MSGFCAKKLLMKQGWEDGTGLGKTTLGMKEAIRVTIKQDTLGIGHDPGKQYTFHWWDHAFNNSANNIIVDHDSDGEVSVKMYKKSRKEKSEEAKKNLYANFIKSSILTSADGRTKETCTNNKSDDSDSDDESDNKNKLTNLQRCTDEQLLEICGGRTAHKGARHGLKASGKLARLEEQERIHNEDVIIKKKKKSKHSDDENIEKPKKKKKKSKHSDDEIEECNIKKSKKKKSKESDIDDNCNKSKKKKSKKNECIEEFNDSKSISKKKRKRDKTEINEIEEVIKKKKKKSK